MHFIHVIALAWLSVFVTVIILFTNDFLKDTSSAIAVWQPWFTAFGVVGTGLFAAWTQDKIDKRETEQRRRKNYAARAVLPASLSQICEYATKCARELMATRRLPLHDMTAPPPLNLPDLPKGDVQVLKECIESADEGPRERLAELLSTLQVQHSRLLSISDPRNCLGLHNFDQFLLDAINIYARSEMLFSYARRETSDDPGDPAKTDILAAGRIMRAIEDDSIQDLIDRRYK